MDDGQIHDGKYLMLGHDEKCINIIFEVVTV
jgi:hypothetical protein